MEPENNEIQLFVSLLQRAPHCNRRGADKALVSEKINWADLIRIAAPHGLLPLLHRNLSLVCADRVPLATLGATQALLHESVARRNRIHAGELFDLLLRSVGGESDAGHSF